MDTSVSGAIDELKARMAGLERELQLFRDYKEIAEVLSRYGYNADCGRDEEYVSLWTEDARIDTGRSENYRPRPLEMIYEGKAGIREFISDPKGHHNESYGKRIHVQGLNPVIYVDGDEALVNDNWMAIRLKNGEAVLGACGNDQWRLRREDGKWLIVERRNRHLGNAEYMKNLDATPA